MASTLRADQQILALGLAPTRSAAQRLVDQGAVEWQGPKGWTPVRKAGESLPPGTAFRVLDDAETRWVSRAGLKLEGALSQSPDLSVTGLTCLDVGQSTGGFTDVLLSRGAARIIGVDVGHGQVHPKLRTHDQVVVLEGLNARHLTPGDLGDHLPEGGFPLIVGDLSFISLTLVLPALRALLAPGGQCLMLVKPQFELQPAQIGKGGLVKDAASYADVEQRIRQACAELDLSVLAYFDSAIAGGDGNREFFVRAQAPIQ
ncbi:MAG TPA: TlyA family RNA methyltransferase [Aquabacterium sp.]|nr:TlyA family RNA methyltransferase [Aquabacterium sp.]